MSAHFVTASDRPALALLALGAAGLAFGGVDARYWRTACPSAGALGLGLVLLAARGNLPSWGPLAWVGRRCLGVYLLHPWAVEWLPWWAVLPATCAAAEVSWRWLEQPARRVGPATGTIWTILSELGLTRPRTRE